MAKTIAAAFSQLRENLEITGLQVTTVSTRQTNVRKVVEEGLTVLDSFLTGSYSRDTMIAPLSDADIDIFVVLDPKYFHHYNNGQNCGQAGLLDRLKSVLRRTYTKTPDVSRNGRAVTIRFSDFEVDVVPGFRREGGGFIIADSIIPAWISTDPKKHVELMAKANSVHKGDLVPLIKMLKGWNKKHNRLLRSFHLEVLALEIFDNVTISNLPSGARYLFDKARAKVTQRNVDPAGYGDDVGRYLDSKEKIDNVVDRLQTAYDRALKAEDFAGRDRIKDALDMWGKIFDDYFPAYG